MDTRQNKQNQSAPPPPYLSGSFVEPHQSAIEPPFGSAHPHFSLQNGFRKQKPGRGLQQQCQLPQTCWSKRRVQAARHPHKRGCSTTYCCSPGLRWGWPKMWWGLAGLARLPSCAALHHTIRLAQTIQPFRSSLHAPAVVQPCGPQCVAAAAAIGAAMLNNRPPAPPVSASMTGSNTTSCPSCPVCVCDCCSPPGASAAAAAAVVGGSSSSAYCRQEAVLPRSSNSRR